MDDEELYERGLKVRRAVLGDAYVDTTLGQVNDFNRSFQWFITRYAWGDVWSRPGLSRRIRSLLTLTMLVALNREDEFRMHVPAALRNGVTREEIEELLLHVAIYCGVPTANSGFNWAAEVLAETDTNNKSG